MLFLILHSQARELIGLSEIVPGAEGYGKTVFEGTRIEKFPVKILGILKNNKFSDKLEISGNSVLIKASGPMIKKSGGIAAGMSGAPIYVNGKLLGALSAGWTQADHTVGLVTPIDDMLKLTYPPYMEHESKQEEESNGNSKIPDTNDSNPDVNAPNTGEVGFLDPPVEINGTTYKKVEICMGAPGKNKDTLYFHPAGNQLMVTGLAPGTVRLAGQEFPSHPVSPITIHDWSQLEPGAAVGLQIARGDINITTLGTLTYYDKDRSLALAFGHPFLHKGDVDYFLSSAYIYYSFSSIDMPFKVGAPLELIGRVVQDRQQGIVGIIGEKPETIPVKLLVKDQDKDLTSLINVDIVSDYLLLSDVVTAMTGQAMNETVNYVGPVTVHSFFSVFYDAGKGRKEFKSGNVSYCTNITDSVTQDLLSMITMLAENEFTPVKIHKIDWQLNITRARKTARILKAKFPVRPLNPGEVIGLNLSIKPYRGEIFNKTVFLKLPENPGPSMNIVLRGGKTFRNSIAEKENYESFEDIISTAEGYPQSNDIHLSWSISDEDPEGIENEPDPFTKTVSTDYILEGYFESILVFAEEMY